MGNRPDAVDRARQGTGHLDGVADGLALLHAPEPLGTAVDHIRHMLQAPFEPGIPIEAGGVKYGWRPGYHAYPLAQPALWTVAAFAAALQRAEFPPPDRMEFERHLAYAQEATRPYQSMQSGGWAIVPHLVAPDGEHPQEHPNTYITALALLALLETRAAGLPWEGSQAQRDHLLHATAHWLIDQFDADGPDPGWHADPWDNAKEVVDGLTLQIYSALLWAEHDAGVVIPVPFWRRSRSTWPASRIVRMSIRIRTGGFATRSSTTPGRRAMS